MQKLLKKKQRILKRIPIARYKDIIKYVKKVYLSDYELKVLMARKFSNLFLSLLPLAKCENGNFLMHQFKKKFANKKEPVIISDRALVLFKEQIMSGKYKKILLVDDIIIHGRTMDKIYRQIESWFKEGGIEDYEIDIYAHVESENGLIKNTEFTLYKDVEHTYDTGMWRAISNEIINIFYLSGTAYTSYVPNLKIDKNSDVGRSLKDKLANSEYCFKRLKCIDMEENSVKAYVYVDTQPPEFALNCNVRIYEYERMDEYVIVPMVMLQPIERAALLKCLKQVESLMESDFVNLLKDHTDDDIIYRAFVYVISAVWGWKFIDTVLGIKPDVLDYEKQEEEINFSRDVLQRNLNCKNTMEFMDSIWCNVSEVFEEISDIDELVKDEEDFKELIELFKDTQEQFNVNGQGQYIKMLLGKFLYLNGLLDEKRCKNQIEEEKSRRLIGVPIYKLAKIMNGLTEEVVCGILSAIDFGKGSIVSRKLQKNNKIYFLSVIHAGEQNYKYYENEYFPFLYGLYHLEVTAERTQQTEKLEQWKKDFMMDYGEYWKASTAFCLQDDLQRLEEMKVKRDYGEAILEEKCERFSDMKIIDALKFAARITGEEL